jgi:DNA-binding NtrC family response regulator
MSEHEQPMSGPDGRDERTVRASRPTETVHQLSIVVARGPDAGKHVDAAPEASAQVGTATDGDLVLTDPKVSRYHLELAPSPDGISVRDLGSLNGTYVGTTRVRDAVVARGAQIKVGDTLLVVDAVKTARESEASANVPGLVYASHRMRELARSIERLSSWTGAILVQGETGTGKELVATGLHATSARKSGPFVIIDCGALPTTLVASELFGHERGAFTGADRRTTGAFERADGGTIFLDEIGELPLTVQPALLGVLQRKRLRRVGGDRDIAVDVRVISATHRDLRASVNQGAFREDLYYRIAGARLVVPSLRERPEDIPLLAAHFVQEITGGAEAPPGFSEIVDAFRTQTWPGNVRELRNAVERALFDGTVSGAAEDDRTDAPADGDAPTPRYRDARAKAIAAFEESYARALMSRCDGNASEAARRAGMDRPYLLSLLRKHGLR